MDVVFDDTQLIEDIKTNFDNQYGLGQQVNIKSFDNINLNASIYSVENSHKYYISTHGLGGSKAFVIPLGDYFFHHGYNFINYDLRHYGQSGGLVLGLGLLDSKDFLSVINYVISKDPLAEIVVSGQSISGLGLLLISSELPENVKCIVIDSGFVNLRDVADNITNNKIPLLLDIANGPFKLVYGKSLNEIDATESIKNNKIPLFYVVGDKDAFVSSSEVSKITNLLQDGVPYQTLLVEQGPHTRSIECDYDNYVSTIFDFCNQFMSSN